jgi:hypothetical protein
MMATSESAIVESVPEVSGCAFLDFPANFLPRSGVYRALAMAVIVIERRWQGRSSFTGLADHDAFTADVRTQSERYEVARHIGESSRSATRASRVPASDCREFDKHRFAARRLPVPPAHVTSASSLRELRKPGVTQMTPGFFF